MRAEWCLALGAVFAILGLAGARAEPLELSELMARFAQSRGVEAEFREEKSLPLLARPIVSEGVFYFVPPDRMVRFTRSPERASMLLDGNRLRIEDALGVEEIDLGAEPTAKQLVTQLLVLLRGDLPALERDYTVKLAGTPEAWVLDLATKSLRIRSVVEGLTLEGQVGRLDTLVLRGANGEVTRTHYTRVVTDRPFRDGELRALFPVKGTPQIPEAAAAKAPAPGS